MFLENPDNFYLLRVEYVGLMGAFSNFTKDKFASSAFHSYPSTLKNEGISGDYGFGYNGFALNLSTYKVEDPKFG